MAESNRKSFLAEDEVKIKKYLYVLRPILSARWILDKQSPPPMLFRELMSAELPQALRIQVDKLLEQKKIVSELGMAPRIPPIDAYIYENLDEIKKAADALGDEKSNGWTELDACFLKILK